MQVLKIVNPVIYVSNLCENVFFLDGRKLLKSHKYFTRAYRK